MFKGASKVVIPEEADKMNITTTSLKQELKLRKIHNSAWRSEATISLKLRLLLRQN